MNDAYVFYLAKLVEELIDEAKTLGYVITIDLKPTVPLKMGGYIMAAQIRQARGLL